MTTTAAFHAARRSVSVVFGSGLNTRTTSEVFNKVTHQDFRGSAIHIFKEKGPGRIVPQHADAVLLQIETDIYG
jgi:hypothetical protein